MLAKHRLQPEIIRGTGRAGGFTIVELMIALSVLSILLLVCTLTLMNIGKMYVKGNNQASAQQAARNIITEISNQIQLGGDAPQLYLSNGYFCIGSTRYSFVKYKQVSANPGAGETRHALWRDTLPSDICPTNNPSDPSYTPPLNLDQAQPSANGVELVPGNMRLTEFTVKPSVINSGLYTVSVGIAYGDDDLLCDRGRAQDCNQTWISGNMANHIQDIESPVGQIACVGNIGEQFCAVSDLNVTVARRMAGE